MSIIGIGTDIVHVPRIEKIIQRYGEAFSKRILHCNELICYQKSHNHIAYIAKRFAVKEAVSKALGTGIGHSVRFNDIETFNDALGKPLLCLHHVTLATANQLGVKKSFVSLSDEKEYVVAFVTLTG